MAKALSKSQIAASRADTVDLTKKQAVQTIEAPVAFEYKNAKKSLTIPGLGKLVLVNRKAQRALVLRQGRVWHLALLGLMTVAHAQQPSFLWAKRAGGPATTDVSISDLSGGICVGPTGAITVVGQLYQTAVFGNRTLTAKGVNPGEPGFEDAFFVRYDAAGTVLWAQRAGGGSRDAAFGVCADGDGNVYATGEFGMMAKFGSQVLSPPPSSPYGNYDAFLTKLDPSGTFLWTQQIGTAPRRRLRRGDGPGRQLCGRGISRPR
mgnify:CR=1 FL=1